MANEVYAFQVSVVGKPDWGQVINARSRGKAKSEYWHDLRESWDIPFTAVRAQKLGLPRTTPGFARTAEYRGKPDFHCGTRVVVGESHGVIVGSNASANFDVLFDDDAPKYAGLRLNVHPQGIEKEVL